jgi:hypothetical protein
MMMMMMMMMMTTGCTGAFTEGCLTSSVGPCQQLCPGRHLHATAVRTIATAAPQLPICGLPGSTMLLLLLYLPLPPLLRLLLFAN